MDQLMAHSVTLSTHVADLLLNLLERFLTWLLGSGVRILVVLALSWAMIRLIRTLTERLHRVMVGSSTSLERVKRADTAIGAVRTAGVIFVAVAGAMMALRETGIDIAPVLATAGIGGLAVGFGAQTLVKDVINGFFLLFEEQVRIGDVVEVAGKSGVVEGLNLRTLRLRDLAGNVHTVPHGNITVVTNMTRDYSRYVLDVQVARAEDPDRIFATLERIGEEMQNDAAFAEDILQPLEILGVDSIAAATMQIRARLTTRVMRQWRVGREFNRRMKKRFDEMGIAAA